MKTTLARLCIFSGLILLAIGVSAQDSTPIGWTIKRENSRAVKAGDKFNLQVVATIEKGWHLYSPEQPEAGPIPTRITVLPGPTFKLAGDIESPLPQVVFDSNFNLDTQFYEGEAIFILPIGVSKETTSGKAVLSVSAFFQTCNDHTCLPPTTVKMFSEIDVVGKAEVNSSAVSKTEASTPPKQQAPAAETLKGTKSVDFDFVDFAGRSRKFSEFRGHVVLIDFWATWCKPCLADIPHLKELYAKYRDKGFEIIGMDSETLGQDAEDNDPEFAKERDERARQIVSTRGATWIHATAATAVPVATKVFAVEKLPTKILIDAQGKIIARVEEGAELDTWLEKLLGGK